MFENLLNVRLAYILGLSRNSKMAIPKALCVLCDGRIASGGIDDNIQTRTAEFSGRLIAILPAF